MKVLSLKQPWASLVALGEKRIETRSWKTSYRGPLLIHASKKADYELCRQHPFVEALNNHDIVLKEQLPAGIIIAICNLTDCVKIKLNESYFNGTELENGELIGGNEYFFGDYTMGRYAWILQDIEPLKEPIPVKGKLRLWDYDLKEKTSNEKRAE